jgi:hypothetical protein
VADATGTITTDATETAETPEAKFVVAKTMSWAGTQRTNGGAMMYGLFGVSVPGYAYSIHQDDGPHDEHGHEFNAHRDESGKGQRGADRDDWREGRNMDQDDWKTRHDPMEEDTNYDQRNWNKNKKIVASEPSEHVIFLGLDPDFMESDVRSISTSSSAFFDAGLPAQLLRFVQSFGVAPDTVTIIRERISGISTFYSLPMPVD